MAKEMTEFNNRLDKLAEYCMNSGRFDQDLYIEYDVKRGLRDSNGKGILTGLTEISDVVAFKSVHGRKIPIDGQLYYQGYNVMNLVEGNKTSRFGFEEITYLLLNDRCPIAHYHPITDSNFSLPSCRLPTSGSFCEQNRDTHTKAVHFSPQVFFSGYYPDTIYSLPKTKRL